MGFGILTHGCKFCSWPCRFLGFSRGKYPFVEHLVEHLLVDYPLQGRLCSVSIPEGVSDKETPGARDTSISWRFLLLRDCPQTYLVSVSVSISRPGLFYGYQIPVDSESQSWNNSFRMMAGVLTIDEFLFLVCLDHIVRYCMKGLFT